MGGETPSVYRFTRAKAIDEAARPGLVQGAAD
jgi:hypothetical protein